MFQRQALVLLVITCLGHVLLISAQVQSKSGLPLIESVAFDGFSRVQAVMAGGTDAGRSVWTNYFALRGAVRENDLLKRRILDLETKLQEEQALADRTRSLEAALALKNQVTGPVLAARVIAGNPSPGSLTVTIDRGTSDGVDVDMAVIAGGGVVGRVIAPLAAHAATVQLLIGRNAGAAVSFARTGVGGIAVGGASDPPLRVEYVPAAAEILTGDRIVTSGQDGIYPEGFAVGTVARVTRSGGTERQIAVQPALDFSHIDVVLVLLAKPPHLDPPR